MSEQKKGLSYRVGKTIGNWPKTTGAILVTGLGLLVGNAVINNRQIEADKLKLEQATAERKAKADQAREQTCGANFQTLQSQASALLKAGSANKAFDLVRPCNLFTGLAAADKAFIQSTSAAASQESSTANRLALAKQEAEAKKVASAEKAARRKEGVAIGMSMQEVLDSSWGKPRKVNRTTGATYENEQWVYGGGYLYFKGGRLATIQN